tara:strand:+ start:694 stop:1086 length:393 start_codon:yes stop_codon:yes gene_type:complete
MEPNKLADITDDFGRFLISREIVTLELVHKALNLQRSKTTLIGALAIQEKLLSINQVFNILEKRLQKQRFFCQIAVELGYLTNAIAKKLLQLQKRRIPSLGDILLDMKAIDKYDLERELRFFNELYKKHQ